MNNSLNKRKLGIDVLKIIACIFVICLHFTNYNYVNIPSTSNYIIMHSIRWLFFSCVALFIITGYLNSDRKLDKKYFYRFFSFLLAFFVYSILTGYVIHNFGNILSFSNVMDYIKYYFFSYNAYFWYVDFYLSLFFIIPFLSIINQNISKKQHVFLIFILILLISIPNFIGQLVDLNSILKESSFKGLDFFKTNSFCFIYYFIGSYIKKYGKERYSILQIIVIIMILLFSLFGHSLLDLMYLKKYQIQFESGQNIYTFHEYGNLFTILTGTSLFLLIKNISLKSRIINHIAKYIGNISFELYLGLAIGDWCVSKFTEKINYSLSMNLKSFSLWVLIEFLSVLLLASIYYYIKKLVKFIICSFWNIIMRRENHNEKKCEN